MCNVYRFSIITQYSIVLITIYFSIRLFSSVTLLLGIVNFLFLSVSLNLLFHTTAFHNINMLDVKELTRAGKDMGLEGEALKSFVSEQQERNDREREREIAIAREERELEKQNYELQLRASELKFQEDEKRLETLAKEMELFQLKKDSQDVAEQSFTSTSGTTHRHKLPPLPCFDETKEEIDHFLNRFEKYFNAADYNPEAKAIVLCSYLKGTALAVFNRLPTEDSNNYEKLKAALLLRYDVTAEKCREDFRRIRIADNESYREFKARLADKLTKWLSQDNKKATYDDLFDLIIKDQLMRLSHQT